MVSRLVIGAEHVDDLLFEGAVGWDGEFRTVGEDPDRVETLRDEDVPATVADPTDPDALREHGPADVVLVAQDGPERALAVVEAAREAFPDATVLAYAGVGASGDALSTLRASADDVIDPATVLGGAVTDLVASRAGSQTRTLRRILAGIDGTLAVVLHDNPDPDAIASGVALAEIARAVGTDAQPCYYGSINHQENRAMVNLLDLDLRKLDPEDDLAEFGGFALVDHSRPGVNDQLPPDLPVDVVIDHHPPRAPVEARFVDLRSEIGATSTLLTDYLRRLGFDDLGGQTVATALLYGIRIDTNDFSREVSRADFEAAAALLPHADVGLLERVESPDVSPDTFATLSRAIRNREVRGSVVASCVGEVNDRDALAQAADRLLDMKGITATIVYGYDDETVYCSARARGTTLDLGETVRIAFQNLGSAGGHADMAGAQLPLAAVLSRRPTAGRWLGEGERLEGDDDDGRPRAEESPEEMADQRLEDVVERTISTAFFDAVREHPKEVPDEVAFPSSESLDAGYVPAEWNLATDEDREE